MPNVETRTFNKVIKARKHRLWCLAHPFRNRPKYEVPTIGAVHDKLQARIAYERSLQPWYKKFYHGIFGW